MSVRKKEVDIWKCDYCGDEKEMPLGRRPGWYAMGSDGFSMDESMDFCSLKCVLKQIGRSPLGLRLMKEVYEEA